MTLRTALRAFQRLIPQRRDHLVLLAYHLVDGGTDSPVDLPRGVFATQLDELSRTATVGPLESELSRLEEEADGSPEGRPRVALTFDDAYENFHEVVWPLLEGRGLPATLFVPVGFVEGECGPPIRATEGPGPCSWSMLREMADSGLVTVGSHSWNHPDLRRLPDGQLERELAGSRRHLEDRLGRAVTTFCYPRGLWNRRVERRVATAYDYATIGGGRAITAANLRPHRLWRTSIRRDGPSSLLPLLTARLWLEEWVADGFRRLRG